LDGELVGDLVGFLVRVAVIGALVPDGDLVTGPVVKGAEPAGEPVNGDLDTGAFVSSGDLETG
jgi:hypothetical protein